MKQNLLLLFALCGISYAHAQDNKGLIINEIMQSNVECIMDDIHEFPDSWVELYNASDAEVNLKDYQISNKDNPDKAWQLPDKTIAPDGYVIIYCDKEGLENNRLHADFRLESGKDGALYLYKGKEIVDQLTGLSKMPAPDIAYGRETNGSDKWGYQLTPTPGKKNAGGTCDAKHILGAPKFSEGGRVTTGNTTIKLELSLPDNAPEDAYITYTTNGSEPTVNTSTTCKKYSTAINITKTTVIRAKVFCEGWLSPKSTAQSYIFFKDRDMTKMTLPVVSIQTNDEYLNSEAIGILNSKNNSSKSNKHDWRRPINLEFFPVEGEASAINQLGETRVQGGQSREHELKSMAIYANKRFDPDHKRFEYVFFPDQKPDVKDFKSFSLRNGGNDFKDLFFRDAIIQRTMAKHIDLDWQACRSAVVYINGEYMGMLNIRERSNEDNIYSNYNGLEDLDLYEISHEKVNNVDKYIEELKEGDEKFYEAFKKFYSEKGHTLEEYEEWMDVSEFLNVMVLNLFYGNLDFPGNNLVFWRPNDKDTKSGLPKIWRVILKDTDYSIGLYGQQETQNNYNTFKLIYNPRASSNSWAYSEVATKLFRIMMENEDLRQMFIDKCCVYMGDFMNGKGTGEMIDIIKEEVIDEFVAHRNKYNPGWGGGWPGWGGGWPGGGGQSNNRNDIENKFNNAKTWVDGRTNYFYNFLAGDYSGFDTKWNNLGTAKAVTVNKNVNENNMPATVAINGIELTKGIFNGKLFPNRMYTISATAPEGQIVKGWKVTKNGQTSTVEGSKYVFTLDASTNSLAIEALLDVGNGIDNAVAYGWQWKRTVGGINVTNVPDGEKVSLYDLRGVLLG